MGTAQCSCWREEQRRHEAKMEILSPPEPSDHRDECKEQEADYQHFFKRDVHLSEPSKKRISEDTEATDLPKTPHAACEALRQAALETNHSDALISPKSKAILEQVRSCIEESYSILEAEAKLCALQDELLRNDGEKEWEQVRVSPMIRRLLAQWEYFTTIGSSVTNQSYDWFTIHEDGLRQHLEARLDDDSSKIVHYRASLEFEAGLAQVMAVANEVELGPHWQPLLVGPPECIGMRTATYAIVHSQMSFVGGLYKVDVLNEVRRFLHPSGAFLAEYIKSLPENHQHYFKPPSGYRRTENTQIMNLWAACGPNKTVLVQVGTLQLPMPVTRWLVSTLGGLCAKNILDGLVRNSLRAAEPGSPWEKPFKDDVLGLYKRLRDCEKASASLERGSKSDATGRELVAKMGPYFQDSQALSNSPVYH
eukprot:TRINITY_DN63412_c0_g1_i1.p1 TRINITY_DN63412_c0_g1~~TRINITY_DN63412_c0_g1_i1.p1  ORF type:complete len:423 (+),score=58.88 TRINITY_DN63412_c0_g1_i1:120-1388(+)